MTTDYRGYQLTSHENGLVYIYSHGDYVDWALSVRQAKSTIDEWQNAA